MKNILRTCLLVAVLTTILLMVGGIVGGPTGVVVALTFSLVFNFIAFWYSDRIVLSMYKAEEINRGHKSGLYEVVERLARKAQLPMPKVYIIPDNAPNAFATGRGPKHAAVAATQGLINNLSTEEVTAVIAHEITHIKDKDTLLQTLVAVIASAIIHITMIARWGFLFGFGRGDEDDRGGLFTTILLIILAPIAAVMIQAAISRSREYMADKGSKTLMGNGSPLASALRKMENFSSRGLNMETASQETAHMFIMSPLSGKALLGLFSTHPRTEDRIQQLLYGD